MELLLNSLFSYIFNRNFEGKINSKRTYTHILIYARKFEDSFTRLYVISQPNKYCRVLCHVRLYFMKGYLNGVVVEVIELKCNVKSNIKVKRY